MFGFIVDAMSKRFARDQKAVAGESRPLSLGPDVNANPDPDPIGVPEDVTTDDSPRVAVERPPPLEMNGYWMTEIGTIPNNSANVAELPVTTQDWDENQSHATDSMPNVRRILAESEIQRRAYLKWEAAGKPKGRDWSFWLEAKQETLQGNE